MRICYDPVSGVEEPILETDQLVAAIHYAPMELDKESPDFVNGLNFLNTAFTFERNQLSLFLRTVYEKLAELMDSESDKDDSTDNVKIVE